MREKDFAVVIFVGKRSAHGHLNGWHIDLVIKAECEKEAVKIAGDMLSQESHVWGKNKQKKGGVENNG